MLCNTVFLHICDSYRPVNYQVYSLPFVCLSCSDDPVNVKQEKQTVKKNITVKKINLYRLYQKKNISLFLQRQFLLFSLSEWKSTCKHFLNSSYMFDLKGIDFGIM